MIPVCSVALWLDWSGLKITRNKQIRDFFFSAITKKKGGKREMEDIIVK